jgi:hypothetical protein
VDSADSENEFLYGCLARPREGLARTGVGIACPTFRTKVQGNLTRIAHAERRTRHGRHARHRTRD